MHTMHSLYTETTQIIIIIIIIIIIDMQQYMVTTATKNTLINCTNSMTHGVCTWL